MLMAGLDGIQNKIHPGEAMDKNLYDLEPEELGNIPSLPSSLEQALKALEDDHEFLLKGGVFSEDLLEAWIAHKRTNEIDAIRVRPHPYEYFMYFDS
jgi:glutamine synthetase